MNIEVVVSEDQVDVNLLIEQLVSAYLSQTTKKGPASTGPYSKNNTLSIT